MSTVTLGVSDFLQKRSLNSSPHFITLLSKLMNLIACRRNINGKLLKTSSSQKPYIG